MTLKSGKVCGVDGLGVEFYRKFWKTLIGPYHQMLQEAFKVGYLSASARREFINLIPKKGKDDKLIKKLEAHYASKLCL